MKSKKSPYIIIGAAIVVIAAVVLFPLQSGSSARVIQAAAGSEEKFALLSGATTNFCAGPQIVDAVESDRLQGSCCSAMDMHAYAEQAEGLKKYDSIDIIPSDPYDIPKEWAREMIEEDKTIVLTDEQQKIYDDAIEMSHEGGPCCCKCWRWYAYGGLAKKLITENGFTAEDVANVWNLSDGCGGAGHAEGMEPT
ncbi:MAG: hypothetical protein HYS81_03410 [Candidatus Aenigmatarchaeota archaeon]|nr:MAG: hypothetical protein HYS81_03410 [Candidatus Aenigmarchaeota archaeon]